MIEEVSRGGQGVVFRARQPGTEREIALKRMARGSFSTTAMRLCFEREVAAAAALNHLGIVTVYGMVLIEGLPVCALEWVDGVSTTRASSRRQDAPRVSREDPRLGASLDMVLAQALSRDREQRYATTQEFAADLRRHLAGEPIRAGASSFAYRARRCVKKHRVAAGFLLTVAFFGGLILANSKRHEGDLAVESTAKDAALMGMEAFLPKP